MYSKEKNGRKRRKVLPSESFSFPVLEESQPDFLGFLFRVCIPSLRIAKGRFTPCNLKYNPQALHTGSPSLFRLHNVVVLVPQLVQQSPNRLVAV